MFTVDLAEHHLGSGRTKHQLCDAFGARDFPPFKTLEICTFAGDSGYYLMYEPETGPGTDTWHQTLEDAMHQAEWEFGVARTEWRKVADSPAG